MSEIRIAVAGIMLASVFAHAIDTDPYGFIRFNGVWSYGAEGSASPNGILYAPPIYGITSSHYISSSLKRANHFDFGASQSTVGINLSDSISEGLLVLTGKLEGDFTSGFSMNYGFINFSFPNIGLGILLGQTDALFVPYNPPTINYRNLVGMGNLDTQQPQIRLMQKISSIEVAVAVRNDYYRSYPAIEGKISTTGPIKIGASAFWLLEEEEGVSTISAYLEENIQSSWGFAADIFADIGVVNVSGEFFTGQNLITYSPLHNVDYIYNKIDKRKSIGGWGALGIKATDNLSFNAGAGSEYITNKYYGLDGIWLNWAIFANINYKLTPNASIALEYFRHNTEYMDEDYDSGSYNRIETAITYGF